MKQIILCTRILFLITSIIFSSCTIEATVIVQGDATGSLTTFQGQISQTGKTFDRSIGTLFVGLSIVPVGSTLAISRVNRYIGASTPRAFGIATEATQLDGVQQRFLSIATSGSVPTSLLVGSPSLLSPVISPDAVFALGHTSTHQTIYSADLIDTSGVNTISSIEALTDSYQFIFTAVGPDGGTFGGTGSGVAVVRITRSTSTFTAGTLTQTDAQTGAGSPRAKLLDPTIAEVKIAGSANPTINNFATMTYDGTLERLYTGLQLAAPNNLVANGIKSVVVGRVDATTGQLTFSAIAPDAVVSSNQDQIVVSKGDGTDTPELAVRFARVMHTSTGLSYLIVNGGNETSDNVGNKIFALPLIDNPADTINNGTLANKNILTNGTFQTVPAASTDIATDFTLSGNLADYFALVGGSPLFPLVAPSGISDIVVIGDAVYASSNTTADTENDAGIFISQAMFDSEGKILRWTPWAKRAFPAETKAGGTVIPNIVNLFEADALDGKVWAVTGEDNRTIETNSWDFGLTTTSLEAQLNHALFDGSYSVLDLHAFTRGLGAENPNRYALFGGTNKVVFARISSSAKSPAAAPYNSITDGSFQVTAPQDVTVDFSNPQDFLVTTLPANAGCATCLEYSRRTSGEGTQGYFFAGTANGLYIFSNSGTGFDITTFGALNATPFTSGSWSKAPALFGAIVDVQSKGQQLYVITSVSTPQKPFSSTLWRIPYANTVTGMFTPSSLVKIAQTGVGVFDKTSIFTGVQIIATGPLGTEGNKEQLVLTTNTGVYKTVASQAASNGIIDAANQTAANWAAINTGVFYSGISGMDTPTPSTVWPVSIADENGKGTFSRSGIAQISGNGNTTGTTSTIGSLNPPNFISSSTNPAFTTLPSTTYFTSNGARRLLITYDSCPCPHNSIVSVPFNTQEWQLFSPNQALSDPVLELSRVYYWIQQIGASGITLAGTNSGTIALE